MEVGAVDLHVLPVQGEPAPVEAEGANAERRLVTVGNPPAGFDRGFNRVEVGVFQGPQGRVRNLDALAECEFLTSRNALRGGSGRDPVSFPVDHGAGQRALQRLGAFVDDCRLDIHFGQLPADLGRGHERPPVTDVEGVEFREPDVAVDAPSLVPPPLVPIRVGAHRHHVLPAEVRRVRDVVVEAGVATPVVTRPLAIDPDVAVPIDAVELQPDPFAPVGGRKLESAAVPAHPLRLVAVVPVVPEFVRAGPLSAGLVGSPWVELSPHHEIVRNACLFPAAVVEIQCRRCDGAYSRIVFPEGRPVVDGRTGDPPGAAGVFHEHRQGVGPAQVPGAAGIQRDLERSVGSLVVHKSLPVEKDGGVVVHGLEVDPGSSGRTRRQGSEFRTEPGQSCLPIEHVAARRRFLPAGQIESGRRHRFRFFFSGRAHLPAPGCDGVAAG